MYNNPPVRAAEGCDLLLHSKSEGVNGSPRHSNATGANT
jgi:hypothetical protein